MANKIINLVLLLFSTSLLQAQSQPQGIDHYYNQRYASAERSFHAAITSKSDDISSWYWLTQSYLQLEKAQQAKDTLAKAPASIQEEPLFVVAKGHILLFLKDSLQAASLFDRALDMTKSKDPEILAAVARANIESPMGNSEFALTTLEKAIKRDKHNPALYVLEGNAYRNIHNGTEAYKSYMKAIGENDKYAEAYYQLAKIFQSQKNTELFLENFNKAVQGDPAYAPAHYELYYYYMYTEPEKGMAWFNKYRPLAEKTSQLDYTYTDLLFLTKDYRNAIAGANSLMKENRDSVPPRLYKLVAYSYKELGDTLSAINFMRNYFNNEVDSNYVLKDFETMAILHASQPGGKDSAMLYYAKAAEKTEDAAEREQYYKRLASMAGEQKNYGEQEKWLGKYVAGAGKVSNVDLFNWGIAAFRSQNFIGADSIFARYGREYPEQAHGFYWQARSKAAIDTAMQDTMVAGLYRKVIDMTANDSTSSTVKTFKINAHSYLAAYAANVEKNNEAAIENFEKILELDPANAQAKKYIDILRKGEANKENEGSN